MIARKMNLQIRHGVIQNNIRKKEQQTFNTSASGTTNVKYTRSSNSPPHIVLSPEDGHVGRNMSCDFKRPFKCYFDEV
jgi:uncharacterized protein YwbE